MDGERQGVLHHSSCLSAHCGPLSYTGSWNQTVRQEFMCEWLIKEFQEKPKREWKKIETGKKKEAAAAAAAAKQGCHYRWNPRGRLQLELTKLRTSIILPQSLSQLQARKLGFSTPTPDCPWLRAAPEEPKLQIPAGFGTCVQNGSSVPRTGLWRQPWVWACQSKITQKLGKEQPDG